MAVAVLGLAPACCTWLVAAAAVASETNATPSGPNNPAPPTAAKTTAAKPTPDEAAQAAAEKTSQERIGKIKKLVFDRRPSALLGGAIDLRFRSPTRKAAPDEGDEDAAMEPADDDDSSAGVAEAGEASGDPAGPKPDKKEAQDPFDIALGEFRRDVEHGRWDRVAGFLAGLSEKEREAASDHLLESVVRPAPPRPGPNGQPLVPEKPVFTAADVVGLARAIPVPLDEKRQKKIAPLVRIALDGGVEPADLVALLREECGRDPVARRIEPLVAANILVEAGRADLADPFLPAVADAVAAADHAALKLRVLQLRGARARDPKAVPLPALWEAAQGLIAIPAGKAEDRRASIEQAVDLLPDLPESTAREWMAKLTADDATAGREMVSAVAARVATGMQRKPRDVAGRTRWLKLLDIAVDGVTAPDAAAETAWREPLALAARAWLAEAVHAATHDTRDVGMRRDPYGNIYYWEEQQLEMRRQQLAQWPVKLADALETRPDERWLALLEPADRPAVEKAIIRLHCKAGEPARALPLLERLAEAHPDSARDLVPAVLDAWKLAHNPNDERTRRMPFFWYFGMEEAKSGIPLSRSLQQRNLAELTEFVDRLRKLPLAAGGPAAGGAGGPAAPWIDEKLLVDCFTTCHSVAEVYSPESIAAVFGPVESLSPTAVARLAAKMRTNLAGTWQKPSVQEQAKTKRKEADIRVEVQKGYATARGFLSRALERHPDHWALLGALAAVDHDENDYQRKIADTPDYTRNRRAALDRFAAAATAYAAATATLPRDEWQGDLLDTWFLASCGACDAGRIDETTQTAEGESGRIRATIESMPPEPREWHADRFAGTLVSRLSKISPAVKYRVVRAGLDVAGDHPKARDARQVFEYYRDLVREIELRADIDGPDRVGAGRPFGVLVSLRHTREIEREAGGFGRYLQNQRSGGMFMFNYGRPLENYRDKFEQAARRALGESFDVRSITFEAETVRSHADAEYGWRRTPYAYLVLAAKDPKVDALPPLRLDLDFLDTSGFVILPVESRRTGLDAAADPEGPRPFSNLALTQILDDRGAAKGELTLEVRATARGLVPELDALIDTRVPGYAVKRVRDDGLAVSRFDPESAAPVVVSERSWAVTLAPAEGSAVAGRFAFPKPKVETAEAVLQRYADADLVTAPPEIDLGSPVTRRLPGRGVIAAAVAGLGVLGLLGLLAARMMRRRPEPAPGFVVPTPATPFAVLELLRDIQLADGLDDRGHAELRDSIAAIERGYFSGDKEAAGDLDLVAVASRWAARGRRRPPRGPAR